MDEVFSVASAESAKPPVVSREIKLELSFAQTPIMILSFAVQ